MIVDVNFPNLECYEVWLNGEKLDYCFYADDEAGVAHIAEVDWFDLERGSETLIPEHNEYGWRFVEVKGNVEIKQIKPLPQPEPTEYPNCSSFDPYCGGGYGCPFVMKWDGKAAQHAIKEYMAASYRRRRG